MRRAGGRTWLVGGTVRDLVLGRQPRDLDIEVLGIPLGPLHALLERHFRVQFVGKAYGVFKLQDFPVDVSIPTRRLPNGDSVSHLLSESDPELHIDEALARRDFTMNAMAWDPATLELRDPFHGRQDLEAGVLRHVSDRFREDPLRVLRGMQLVARFQLTAAPQTLTLCRTLTQEKQPRERLWEEWKKLLLQGVKPSLGLRFLRDCGWLRFYPELAALEGCEQDPMWHPEGDVWVHTLHCLDWYAAERTGLPEEDVIAGLGVLCHDFGKPATTERQPGRITSRGHEPAGEAPTRRFLARLTNQEDLINEVVSLVRCHLRPQALYDQHASDSAVRRLARQVSRIDRLVRVARADHGGRPPRPFDGFPAGEWLLDRARALQVEAQPPTRIVMGRHLAAMGVQPGPEMGRLLDECYEAQLDGAFSSLTEGLALAREKLGRACD
ncbi:MAG: HD domain-containing protein [Nitrospiraceae bacterium]|nr:HD domain-containing protein [Nitrospiraceae bacterium]